MPFKEIAGGIGSIVGGFFDRADNKRTLAYNAEQAQKDRDFQKEVFQNQYQWKALDAQKAGLHPLSVIGGSSYSASPSSIPASSSSNMSSVLGKVGESIGDAYTAYKSKDDLAAEKAIQDLRDAETFRANQAESEARTDMYKANAAEARARAESYTRPMASGKEIVPGQVEATDYKPKFTRFREIDGSLSGRKPSDDYQGIHDDKPGLEYYPWLEAWYYDIRDYLDRVGAKFSKFRASDLASRRAEVDKRHARFTEHFPEPRW